MSSLRRAPPLSFFTALVTNPSDEAGRAILAAGDDFEVDSEARVTRFDRAPHYYAIVAFQPLSLDNEQCRADVNESTDVAAPPDETHGTPDVEDTDSVEHERASHPEPACADVSAAVERYENPGSTPTAACGRAPVEHKLQLIRPGEHTNSDKTIPADTASANDAQSAGWGEESNVGDAQNSWENTTQGWNIDSAAGETESDWTLPATTTNEAAPDNGKQPAHGTRSSAPGSTDVNARWRGVKLLQMTDSIYEAPTEPLVLGYMLRPRKTKEDELAEVGDEADKSHRPEFKSAYEREKFFAANKAKQTVGGGPTTEAGSSFSVQVRPYTEAHDYPAHIDIVCTVSWTSGTEEHQHQLVLSLDKDNCEIEAVGAMAEIHPCFQSVGGDRVYTGDGVNMVQLRYTGEPVWSSGILGAGDFGPWDAAVRCLRRYTVHGASIVMAMGNSAGLEEDMQTLWGQFLEPHPDRLLQFWDGRMKHVQYRPVAVVGAADGPNLAGRTRVSYRNLLEFFTYEAVGLRRDYDFECLRAGSVYRMRSARFLRLPGEKSANTLIMLVEDDADVPMQLQDDEKVSVRIHRLNAADVREDDWHGTVTSAMPTLRVTDRVFVIRRSYSREYGSWLGSDTSRLGRLPSLAEIVDAQQSLELIDESTPFTVDIRVHGDEQAYKRRSNTIAAVAELVWRERAADPSVQSVTQDLVCASRLDRLPDIDFLADFTPSELEVLTSSVAPGQREFIQALRKMPAGFALVQGCAGAGKSHVLVHVLVHYILHLRNLDAEHREGLRALVATPINANAEGLLRTFLDQLSAAKVEDAVVIRKYSKTTDRALFTHTEDDRRNQDHPRALDLDDATAAVDGEWAAVAREIFGEFVRRQSRVYSRDKRVTVDGMGHSISAWTLAVLDQRNLEPAVLRLRAAIPAGLRKTLEDALETYKSVEEIQPNDRAAVSHSFRAIADAIYAHSDVVVCTISTAASASLYLGHKPRVFVIDEAAKTTSTDGLCWAFYGGCHARILVGDTMQSRPRVLSPPSVNPFAVQLQLSLFARLQLAGFPTVELLEQHRFGPGISRLLGDVFYKTPIACAPGSLSTVMKGVRRFQGYMKGLSGVDGLDVVLLAPSGTQDARLPSTGSKFNVNTAAVTWTVVDGLLGHGYTPLEIGIVTPYSAQRTIHENIAHARAASNAAQSPVDRVRGAPLPSHGFLIETSERAQSLSRDILVVDIPTTSNLGFVSEATRLCTALSRTRYGLIIVMDVEQVEKLTGTAAKAKALASIINDCKRRDAFYNVGSVPKGHTVWSLMPNVSAREHIVRPTDAIQPRGLELFGSNPDVDDEHDGAEDIEGPTSSDSREENMSASGESGKDHDDFSECLDGSEGVGLGDGSGQEGSAAIGQAQHTDDSGTHGEYNAWE